MAKQSECQNENLWEAVRRGTFSIIDRCIYKGLEKRTAAAIRAILPHSTKDDRDEIFQETVVRIWSRLKARTDMDGNFQGYFFTVLRRCAIDYAKRPKVPPAAPEQPSATTDTADEEPYPEAVLQGLGSITEQTLFPRLTADEQEILDLAVRQELTYEEITERRIFLKQNGEPLDRDTLKVKKARALINLRSLVVLHFLDACKASFPDGTCADLLRQRYEQKKTISDLKKRFGAAAEQLLARCLGRLQRCIFERFNQKISLP